MIYFKHKILHGIKSFVTIFVSLIVIMVWQTPLAKADEVLRNMRGEISSIESLHQPDKWMLVMIWASNCHVCNNEASQYSDFHAKHAKQDAQIIGLSLDGQNGKRAALDFIKRNNVTFPNLIGEVGAVASWYQQLAETQFRGTPTFVLFSPKGELKAVQVGAVSPEKVEKFIASNG